MAFETRLHLETLDRLCLSAQRAALQFDSATWVIAVQHLLQTNIELFDVLLRLGLQPQNIIVVGKGYSTSQEVTEALRARGIAVFPNTQSSRVGEFAQSFEQELTRALELLKRSISYGQASRVLVLDDGGRLIARIAKELPASHIVGIEQTTSGIRKIEKGVGFPVVNVAQSAAKLAYESPLIAEAILSKLAGLMPTYSRKQVVGVVGLGSVGRSMVSGLESQGHTVFTAELPQFQIGADLRKARRFVDLLRECDLVFGCSGTDLFCREGLVKHSASRLYLASCSSEDIEFLGLLKRSGKFGQFHDWPAPDLVFREQDREVTILRGGYPINFDETGVSARNEDIQLTTSLVLGGILVAYEILSSEFAGRQELVPIPPELQSAILCDWFSVAPAISRLPNEYVFKADLETIKDQTRGQPVLNLARIVDVVSHWPKTF